MEILRVKAEVNSSTRLPARGATQFVVLQSLDPKVKTVTLQVDDLDLGRSLKDRKLVTIIILEDEDEAAPI